MSVDLPAPFAPSSAQDSPLSTRRQREETAEVLPPSREAERENVSIMKKSFPEEI